MAETTELKPFTGTSYSGLHHWVKRNIPKPNECPECGSRDRRLEMANISGKYEHTTRNRTKRKLALL